MFRQLKWPLLLLAFGVAMAATITADEWWPVLVGEQGSERPTIARVQSSEADEHEVERQRRAAEARRKAEAEAAREARRRKLRAEREAQARAAAEREAAERAAAAREGARSRDQGSEEGSDEDGEKDAEDEDEAEEEGPIETVEGQLVNPNIHGRLNQATARRIRGWVQNRHDPEDPPRVEIEINEEHRFNLTAERRVEHDTLGVIWFFEQDRPPLLQEREQHVTRAFVTQPEQHGRTELAGSPRRTDPIRPPQGRVEAASPDEGITGYAWNPDRRNRAVNVVVRAGGNIVAEGVADQTNELLRERRIAPHNNCAFRIPWPNDLHASSHGLLQVFAVDHETGEERELQGSPRSLSDLEGAGNKPPIGRFDIMNKNVVAGWAYDPDAGSAPIDVELWVDGQMVTRAVANSKRDGLANSNVTPTPYHGFVINTPTELLTGRTHTVRVYALSYPDNTRVELQGSPRQYRMEENSDPVGGFWRADENLLRGWAADPDLGLEPCEIEIYINGKLWKRTKADRREEWLVGTGHTLGPNHGFAIRPPDFVRDGEEHEVVIYAVNFPEGPPRRLGTRTIGVGSMFPGFWTNDRLRDTRIERGLQVTSVSAWHPAYHEGVQVGDVLLSWDGIEAGGDGTRTSDFREWLNENKEHNDRVQFTFWRDGSTYDVSIPVRRLRGR
jgi:hypothetical protein